MRTNAVLFLLLAAAATAQDPGPTFRAGSRLVQVDVVAREKNAAAKGLTKPDFTLLDNGKPREIALFSVTEAATARPSVPLPNGAVSNRVNSNGEAPSSATILLIDRLNTPANNQVYANQKVLEFLRAHGNKDRLGIYTLGNSVRVIQDLTDDPDRLNRAVRGLKPQDANRMSADVAANATGDAVADRMAADALSQLQDFIVEDRVQTTREALEAIARHLAKVPGRKNLIWVSGSFPLMIARDHYIIDFSKQVDEAARVLNDANVAVYAVDARGLMGMTANTADQGGGPAPSCVADIQACQAAMAQRMGGGPNGLDTMNFLTGLTGGRAFYNSNGIDDSIRKAIEDAEITYTLGFYAPADVLDDKFHKLAVKVGRKGVEVRLRNGYLASKIGAQAAPATMKQLLGDSLDATAIGITVEAKPGDSNVYDIRAMIDLHDIHLKRQGDQWKGAVDVALFVEGTKSGKAFTTNIDIPDSDLAAALERGIVVAESVEAAGPAGELRVVAQDRATGAAGSIRVMLSRR